MRTFYRTVTLCPYKTSNSVGRTRPFERGKHKSRSGNPAGFGRAAEVDVAALRGLFVVDAVGVGVLGDEAAGGEIGFDKFAGEADDEEGLRRWMPGSTQGYDELEKEARQLHMLSER